MRFPHVFVAVILVSGCASSPPPPTTASPKFNLIGDYDVNGFFLNPTWSGSSAGTPPLSPHPLCDKPPLSAACNDQRLAGAGIDVAATKPRRDGCEIAVRQGLLPGHVNLGVATFEGALTWSGLSFDGDYRFLLHPRQGGLTNVSKDCLNLDFNAAETLAAFDCLSTWWKQYREMAHEFHANDLLVRGNGGNAPFAIVTGLLGFDCQHGCVTDLHPVYMMAIRRSGGAREEWAFFVRNWGSEGWCSASNHTIATRRLRVLLPYSEARNSNALMEVQSSFQLYGGDRRRRGTAKSAAVDVVAVEGGVLVTFDLPDPGSRPVIVGELSFRWLDEVQLTAFDDVACPIQESPTFDAAFDQLRHHLPATQTAAFFAVPKKLLQPSMSFSAMIHETSEARIELTPPLAIGASVSSDPIKQKRDTRRHEEIRDLCTALEQNADIKQRDDYQTVCEETVLTSRPR